MATSPDQSIIVFDVETTGLSTSSDQIVEISIQRGLAPESPRWTKRFKPSVPIKPGAQERHGIRLEDLEGCPGFAEHAAKILGFFNDAEVVAGYNVRFDLDILSSEMKQAGLMFDMSGKTVIDAFRLWQACESRKLEDAVSHFLGQKHEAAHSAEGDVVATAAVLKKMIDAFGLTDRSWDAIAEICPSYEQNWIGPSKHFQWYGGEPVFGFSDHRGRLLLDVYKTDYGFFEWMRGKNFPPHVEKICRALELAETEDEFLNWLRLFSPARTLKPEVRAEKMRRAHDQIQAWEQRLADEAVASLLALEEEDQ